jgi:hypothetical protein
MRLEERQTLRSRFHFRCGYCGVREREAAAELTVDHFQPRSQGGADEPENWVYCCHACNEFKGDYWQPGSPRRILHPLHDDLALHFVEEADGTLGALTETGAFHIDQLHLNREPLVENRRLRRRREAFRRAEARWVADLDDLREQVRQMIAAMRELHRRDPNA